MHSILQYVPYCTTTQYFIKTHDSFGTFAILFLGQVGVSSRMTDDPMGHVHVVTEMWKLFDTKIWSAHMKYKARY